MIDLENLPSPEVLKLHDFPGINEALIREKFTSGNVDYLVSLFNFIQRSKHRAENLAQVYFNQMEVFHKKLNGERNVNDSVRAIERKASTPKLPEPNLALDL